MSYGCDTCKPLLKARTLTRTPLRLLFDNCQFYSPKLPEPNVLLFTCPSCGTRWEFQVEDEAIWIGYAYFPLHFAGVEAAHIEGLKVTSSPTWLQVSVGDNQWAYPKLKPATLEEMGFYKQWVAKANRAKQLLRRLVIGK